MEAVGLSTNTFSAPPAYAGRLVADAGRERATPDKTSDKSGSRASSGVSGNQKLTAGQEREVARLQQIDRAVRAHEQAHMAAGQGVVTSGPSYSYTYGPDGKQYATGGEVGIDTSGEKKPEDAISKGIRIQSAALAPRDPSSQDYRVASVGSHMEEKGRMDLAEQSRQETASALERTRQKVEQSYSVMDGAYAAMVSVFA